MISDKLTTSKLYHFAVNTGKLNTDMSIFVKCDDKLVEEKWNNFTLIVPCVSVGNVAQLAADLIISTLWMNKVGYLQDDSIIPVIGNDPFATGDPSKTCRLMTAAEVFQNDQHKLVVLQLRSGIVPGRKDKFVTRLMDWISECKFQQIVMLTSTFSHERTDSQLEGTQFRYIPSSHFEKTQTATEVETKLKWPVLEKRSPVATPHPAFRESLVDGGSGHQEDDDDLRGNTNENVADKECEQIFLPGGGYAKQLLHKCIQKAVPAVVLLRFCAEGDNIPDAMDLANHLNSWLEWFDKEEASRKSQGGRVNGWRIPSSWRLHYGSGFDQILYH